MVRYSGVCNSVACHLQSVSALPLVGCFFTQVCFDIPALSHTAWLLQKTLSSGQITEEQCGCVVCCQLLVVEHITSMFHFCHTSALLQSVGLLKETLVVGPLEVWYLFVAVICKTIPIALPPFLPNACIHLHCSQIFYWSQLFIFSCQRAYLQNVR